MPKPGNYYDSVNSVAPEIRTSDDYLNVRATPDNMGAAVGGALQRAGAIGEETGNKVMQVATHYAEMATEAKANDVIANQWAPQAATLRANFDQLQGQDKIQGYDGYISNLQSARNDFINQANSPYEKQILGNYITRHIAQEVDGARREQVQAIKQFGYQAHLDKIGTDVGYAVNNYNNPSVVSDTMSRVDGEIEKHGIDEGQPQAVIDQKKDSVRGYAATGMVGRAVAAGDVNAANMIYDQNKQYIPGDQQLQVDKTLHAENIRQTSTNGVRALMAGQPLPQSSGTHPAQVRALVADTAQTKGIDPNAALTVLRIESSDGQNLGTRGTIGQTSKKGGTLEEQASDLCDELKKGTDTATKALGRQAEPWEGYAVYQQGAGGAPALFKAAQDDPTARAVDILAPLYKNPKDALSAVVKNGGNATMTAGQFLDFIKQKYNDTEMRAKCDFTLSGTPVQTPIPSDEPGQTPIPTQTSIPEVEKPGDAIMAPHTTPGIAVQPGATAVQSLKNFNDVYPTMVQRIQAIPNVEEREGVYKALEQKRTMFESAAAAERQNFHLKVGQLVSAPTFTDMNQIPPEMKAGFADEPQLFTYAEHMADYNMSKSSGGLEKKYGAGYSAAEDRIFLPKDDPQAITDEAQLWQLVKEHKITKEGWKDLSDTISQIQNPKGQMEQTLKKNTVDSVLNNIMSAKLRSSGFASPEENARLQNARLAVQQADEEAIKAGKTASQRYSPDSKDFVGAAAKPFLPTPAEKLSNAQNGTAKATVDDPNTVKDLSARLDAKQATLADLKAALADKKMTRATAEQLARQHGLIR